MTFIYDIIGFLCFYSYMIGGAVTHFLKEYAMMMQYQLYLKKMHLSLHFSLFLRNLSTFKRELKKDK